MGVESHLGEGEAKLRRCDEGGGVGTRRSLGREGLTEKFTLNSKNHCLDATFMGPIQRK